VSSWSNDIKETNNLAARLVKCADGDDIITFVDVNINGSKESVPTRATSFTFASKNLGTKSTETFYINKEDAQAAVNKRIKVEIKKQEIAVSKEQEKLDELKSKLSQ